MRLLRTIGGIDFTGQERAAHNKLTMPSMAVVVARVTHRVTTTGSLEHR